MPVNTRHLPISLIYIALLSWIYLAEIVPYWSYMGFQGSFSLGGAAICLTLTLITSALIPQTRDTRMAILTCVHYLAFLPTTIVLTFSSAPFEHYIAFAILWSSLTFLSALPARAFVITALKPKYILVVVFGAILMALLIQAAFGGLDYFNLNIERVYEFRREAASNLPMIFGYVYSNVASVLVPLALVLSFRFKAYWLVALALGCSVILFGMTAHKSVLFAPLAVALLYVFFSRMKSPQTIGWVFLAAPILCGLELLYIRVLIEFEGAGYINSLIARRVLFVPSMLDGLYIDFFSHNLKYYWSASRLGAWAAENPHGIAAPFLIGTEYFSDNDTSANTGAIGSGYSNAGLMGVAIYSVVCGGLLALLNAYGRRIGHPLVTAVSLSTVFNVVTTTDLLTAILTHGLLLLLVMLALFPMTAPQRKISPTVPR